MAAAIQRELRSVWETGAARALAAHFSEDARSSFARAFAASVLTVVWEECCAKNDLAIPIPSAWIPIISLGGAAQDTALLIGRELAELEAETAAYRIGAIYTAALPPGIRSKAGAFYTPPSIANALVQMLDEQGLDWSTASVLDPSCGGGALLISSVLRICQVSRLSASKTLEHISANVRGFELDPFAGWMGQVLLEIALMPLVKSAGRRLPTVVSLCDSLSRQVTSRKYDVVIGNPPFGRITLASSQRLRFAGSLYGHANTYGLFTHAALDWVATNGFIAYLTPTSFLGGQYFRNLRALMLRKAPPVSMTFIPNRQGVFEEVLQETMLTVYAAGRVSKTVKIAQLSRHDSAGVRTEDAGTAILPEESSAPWLIARHADSATLVSNAGELKTRLSDYGYSVSTGPLVWNRHKDQFEDTFEKGLYPVVWAESIRADGTFDLRYERRNHRKFFRPASKDHWILTRRSCVLLQRTTAKEQRRRLIAAELPAEMIARYRGVVVENHINMIVPLVSSPPVSPAFIAALFNDPTVDAIFRCMNGSVAVSAYELMSIPMPPLSVAKRIDKLLQEGTSSAQIGIALRNAYAGWEQNVTSAA